MRLLLYISSVFIVLFSIVTVIFNTGQQKDLSRSIKMYPYFSDIRQKIDTIDIRYPDQTISLVREQDRWYVTTADNFPANVAMIDSLYQAINDIDLIDHKTQQINNFPKIGLLNPNYKEKQKGEGTRIRLLVEKDKPYIDFIVGDVLKSYVNSANKRIFTRYATGGGAYLAQALTDFQYDISDFFTPDFGMPKIDEIISARLMSKEKSILTLHRVIEDKNAKNILFMPPSIPKGKRLIYPLVMRDYMLAFIEQLKPMAAIYLPLEKSITDVSMLLELTNARLVKINFWHSDTEDKYYMRIVRDDMQTPHNQYIYQIKNSDYDTLIQPLSKFLIEDTMS